ncbi:MarR family winged helix-turn-helix transcriptional regulator [Nitratireductor mangrovi]|nr:MarR family winged helix-turn-helix transcriptional regulator [Nitratireductor mangrovi]
MSVRTDNNGSRQGKSETKEEIGTEPVDVPPMATIIGYKLRRAQLYVFQDFLETFSRLKLRPAEFSVLTIIANTPGLKQSEIAEMLGIKRANFVALMDGIEKRGLAERRKADTDRRSHSLHLTPQGTKFVRKMAAVWAEHENRMIARLGGPEERDRLIELLDRLLGTPEN